MSSPKSVVELLAKNLDRAGDVYCPNPAMPLWSAHPKVYLNVANSGEAKCPYCGTVYRLKVGETVEHRH